MTNTVSLKQKHEAKLQMEVLQAQLSPKQKHYITEDTVHELTQLAENPDYGPEFLDMYRDHLNILGDNPKFTTTAYMSAVKFFSLTESGVNITDSYIIVFPERMKARADRGQEKDAIRGEASRYNATALVNEIRKVATIPVKLVHRHLFHEALNEQAHLMRNAKSEMVRQKAGEVLIRELKQDEEAALTVKVEDNTGSVIEQLAKAAKDLALHQQDSVVTGTTLKDISKSRIQEKVVEDVEEAEVVEEEAAPLPIETTKTEKWTF